MRHQSLGPGYHAVRENARLVGFAFPVQLYPVTDVPPTPYQGLFTAIESVGEGDVIIAATGRAGRAAVWGELISTACGHRGARGVVTDGATRDVGILRELSDFEVFSQGVLPADVNGRFEWTGHGEPVEIDGVRIARGDLVVADEDGVVVVPESVTDEVVRYAVTKTDLEQEFRVAIRDGMGVRDAFAKFGVL